MMRFVQRFVDRRMVQTAVDEVDAEVGEDQEERELKVAVPASWAVCEGIVELGVSADFSEEEGGCEDCDPGHGAHSLSNFHPDLVLEEFGVLEGCFVEDEDVREGGDDEVD